MEVKAQPFVLLPRNSKVAKIDLCNASFLVQMASFTVLDSAESQASICVFSIYNIKGSSMHIESLENSLFEETMALQDRLSTIYESNEPPSLEAGFGARL